MQKSQQKGDESKAAGLLGFINRLLIAPFLVIRLDSPKQTIVESKSFFFSTPEILSDIVVVS